MQVNIYVPKSELENIVLVTNNFKIDTRIQYSMAAVNATPWIHLTLSMAEFYKIEENNRAVERSRREKQITGEDNI